MNKQLLIIYAALALLASGAGVVVLFGNPEGKQFSQAYGKIELGMEEREVHATFGREPDFWCRYRTYRVCYYESPGWFAQHFDDVEIRRGDAVASLKELPDVYDAVQLAFDANGQLYAYTQIGETYAVETSRGAVHGSSSFAELDDSNF